MLASSQPVATSSMHCPNGHDVQRAEISAFSCQLTILSHVPTLQNFVDNLSVESSSHCHSCNQHLIRTHVFDFPPILAFDLSGHTTLLTKSLNITQRNGQCTTYELRGVIYPHTDHFTACIITSDGMVWHHDGIATGQQTEYEGHFDHVSNMSTNCSRRATSALCVRVVKNLDLLCI
ncbi:hypothetical protein L208DRAFT_1512403 [Tricholoma matsutake]|nr:hypothetical protein L208DRAFT_1512403 [Tricholoma matsutake 945]